MGVMVAKRSVVSAAIFSLVLSLVVVSHASAATRRCSFELFDFRIEAQQVLIRAQRDFSHDILSFNSAVFGADSSAELRRDYAAAARDLGNDFGDALID